MTLLLKVMWSDSLWGWLSLAGEVNRLVACPFHCSPSCVPWFLLGFCSGLTFCVFAIGLLSCVWIFRSELFPSCPLVVPGTVRRSRLAGYLE